MNEQDLRAIPEVSYLNTDNTARYRAILQYCFIQHERLHHYVYPEELYQYMRQSTYFSDYTEEQLQQDLKQLVNWNNLLPRQETSRAQTIEDFKRKRFRYQCTPYTIEIQRMIGRLQQISSGFGGGSLEVKLFDRLEQALSRYVSEGPQMDASELYQTWEDLYGYYSTMVNNAADYLAHLKSDKVEEQMKTEAFIVYKNSFTQYLQQFILSMQRASYKIEALLRNNPADGEIIMLLSSRLADYQLSIPRLDRQPSRAEWLDSYQDKYQSLSEWFLGRPNHPSELLTLQQETTDTIRKIARFAQRIGERQQAFRSRRHDYLHLAAWFADMAELGEAQQAAAVLFGVQAGRHYYLEPRVSDNIDASVWEEVPHLVAIAPRVAGYREKSRPSAVVDRSREKEEARLAYLSEQQQYEHAIEQLIADGKIFLQDLPLVDPYVRKTLLTWIARCMQREDRQIQTETGRKVRLQEAENEQLIVLRSTDGELEMPNYTLYIR